MNFSHGSHEGHRAVYDAIRAVEEETGRPIGVLADLQGPKLRLGTFADGKACLESGAAFRLDLTDQPGNERRAPMPHAEIFDALTHGSELLLDDGKVRLRVESCGNGYADTRVEVGGWLSDKKGVNLPNARLDISALTEKDRADLEFALELGVDWVALSFVQRPEDLVEARELTQMRVGLMAKLEKPSAIDQLEAVVAQSDAVMVARGDLGVEMQPEDVPVLQSQIVDICRAAGKPVVVATQMLDSMVRSPSPTRAEASDVASAVYQGADAVMLSAESAVGDFPVESVAMMDRIIKRVQRDPKYRSVIDAYSPPPRAMEADAVTTGARQMAETLSAALIRHLFQQRVDGVPRRPPPSSHTAAGADAGCRHRPSFVRRLGGGSTGCRSVRQFRSDGRSRQRLCAEGRIRTLRRCHRHDGGLPPADVRHHQRSEDHSGAIGSAGIPPVRPAKPSHGKLSDIDRKDRFACVLARLPRTWDASPGREKRGLRARQGSDWNVMPGQARLTFGRPMPCL